MILKKLSFLTNKTSAYFCSSLPTTKH